MKSSETVGVRFALARFLQEPIFSSPKNVPTGSNKDVGTLETSPTDCLLLVPRRSGSPLKPLSSGYTHFGMQIKKGGNPAHVGTRADAYGFSFFSGEKTQRQAVYFLRTRPPTPSPKNIFGSAPFLIVLSSSRDNKIKRILNFKF